MKYYICNEDLKLIIDTFNNLDEGDHAVLNVYGPTIKEAERVLGKGFEFRIISYDQFEIRKAKSTNQKQLQFNKAVEDFNGEDIELPICYNTARTLIRSCSSEKCLDLRVSLIDGKTYLRKKKVSIRGMVNDFISSGSDKLEISNDKVSSLEYLRILCSGRGYSPIKTDTGYMVIRKDVLEMERKRQQIVDMQSKLNEMIAEFEKEHGSLDDDEIID